MLDLLAIGVASATEAILMVAAGVAGLAGLLLSVYLLAVSVAALFHRPRRGAAGVPHTRTVVVVPAHDEEAVVARCVRSLRRQTYPHGLTEIVVVADNCTDATAPEAAAAGARVLIRDAPGAPGKGRALRWALDRILADDPEVDAIAIVDADAVADPGFLAVAVAELEAGAPVVQAEDRLAEDGTAATALRVAAFLLVNAVQQAGRAMLGLPARLCGSGMLLSRGAIERLPWSAFTNAEDAEYSVALCLAGIPVAFAAGAGVVSAAAPDERAASQQAVRWEGGRARLARAWVPRLLAAAVRERRPALLDAALQIALPPLSVLAGSVVAGAALAGAAAGAGALPVWVFALWAAAAGCVALHVIVGLQAAAAPASAYRALAHAPLFVARKLLRTPSTLISRADRWVRTERVPGAPR